MGDCQDFADKERRGRVREEEKGEGEERGVLLGVGHWGIGFFPGAVASIRAAESDSLSWRQYHQRSMPRLLGYTHHAIRTMLGTCMYKITCTCDNPRHCQSCTRCCLVTHLMWLWEWYTFMFIEWLQKCQSVLRNVLCLSWWNLLQLKCIVIPHSDYLLKDPIPNHPKYSLHVTAYKHVLSDWTSNFDLTRNTHNLIYCCIKYNTFK